MKIEARTPAGADKIYLHHSTIRCLARVIKKCDHPEQMIKMWDGLASCLYDCDMRNIHREITNSDQWSKSFWSEKLQSAENELQILQTKGPQMVALSLDEAEEDFNTSLIEARESFRQEIKNMYSKHRSDLKKIKEAHDKMIEDLMDSVESYKKWIDKTPLDALNAHLQFQQEG